MRQHKEEGDDRYSHTLSPMPKPIIIGVVDQGIDTLKVRLDRIGMKTTEHYIAEELLTSQDVGSSATERLCADWIFR